MNVLDMKKSLYIWILIALTAAMLAGCAKPAASQSAGVSATPDISATPVPTTAPDVTKAPASAGSDEDLNQITLDGWIYYLDENDPVVTSYGEDAPLHRKSEDGGSDEDFGLRGFEFDIIGSYIYLDSNYPDLDENGNQAWYTTRMNLDGSNPRRLEYGSMSARLSPEGEQKFYFTTMGDRAVYASDFSCENVTAFVITLPDESDLSRKLPSSRELQMDINEIADGWVSFDVVFLTPEGIQMYKGTYKVKEDGTGTEKISGTYYDYQSLESELD